MSDSYRVVKPGLVLQDRYEILERVARGGFAVVWRATDRLLGKEVALKVLHDAIADDEAAVEDLKRETLQSRQLTHENIVQTYDFLQDGNVVAIAMEYIQGETLATLAARQPNRCFEPAGLAEWVGGICDALDYAHSERGAKRTIVHHDLKPGNFMVDQYGHVKVLDFGISKNVAETKYEHTGQFAIAGTPPYMSPQQLRGQRPRPSDDVYSLGATLYALLTSRPPFYRGDIQLQIPHDVPPSMTDRRRELEIDAPPLPADWEEIVAACLAKEPGDRPATMGEIAVRLGLREPTSRSPATARPAAPASPVGNTRVLGTDGGPAEEETDADERGAKKLVPALAVAGVLLAGLGIAYSMGALDSVLGRGEGAATAASVTPVASSSPGGAAEVEPPTPARMQEAAEPAGNPANREQAWATLREEIQAAVARQNWDRAARLVKDAPTEGTVPAWWNDLTELVKSGQARDTRIAELRHDLDRALDSGRWAEAQTPVAELLALLPDDPAALDARDRIAGELDQRAQVGALRRDVQRAIDGRDWDGADRCLMKLRPLVPGDAEVARWTSTVESERARADRVAELLARIPREMEIHRWEEAQEALDQLQVQSAGHPRIAEWGPVIQAQRSVREVVARYRETQMALDAAAYRSLWLSLSDRDYETIRRSYGDMRSQNIDVHDLRAEISGDTAKVRFRETRSFDLRAGGHHETQSQTVLTLRRNASMQWKIAARSMEQ